MRARLGSIAGTALLELATLVGVWALVGVPVGNGLVAVWTAFGGPRPGLTTPLVLGVGVVAVLDVLDRRPSIRHSLGFFIPWAVLGPAHAVLNAYTSGAILQTLAVAVRLTVASTLAFAGGYRWLFDAGHTLVARLARVPRDDSR